MLLIWLQTGEAQKLSGSFGTSLRFYKKCSPYAETIQTDYSDLAWKGERISKPFLIWAGKDTVEDISFEISDFVSSFDTISSINAKLRSIKYARSDHVSKPCEAYHNRDSMSFLELGDILTLSLDSTALPGCPLIYWLSVDIPTSAESGDYSGKINVLVSGEKTIAFNINIQVVDYFLPKSSAWNFHLDLWQFPTKVADRFNENHPSKTIEYWSEEHFALLKREYTILADMGQKVITAHIKEGALGSSSMIKWIRKPNGLWEYDYSNFDKYVDSLTAWGISEQISCHSPVGWNSDVIPFWDESDKSWMKLSAPVGSDTYAECWDHFLTDFRRHLNHRAWFNRSVLYLDEVGTEELREVIQLIKHNHPEWKIGMAGFHTPSDFVDSNVYDMSLMIGIDGNPGRNVSDKISTFYTSCNPPSPNNFVVGDARPLENIWMGWHAHHMNYNGYLRWAFDNWKNDDPYEQRTGGHTSGDFALSYRSSNERDMEICSSLRLELMREGIEDFEKINILKMRLEESGSSSDILAYKRLMNKIEAFTAASGESSEIDQLVESARHLLNEICTEGESKLSTLPVK